MKIIRRLINKPNGETIYYGKNKLELLPRTVFHFTSNKRGRFWIILKLHSKGTYKLIRVKDLPYAYGIRTRGTLNEKIPSYYEDIGWLCSTGMEPLFGEVYANRFFDIEIKKARPKK